jgi:xylulokinase
MEGIILNLKASGDLIKKIGIPAPRRIIASGGGARSQIWLQIQADIFGTVIYTSKSKEQACMGAAITAAVGTGIYRTLEQACTKMIKMNAEVTVPKDKNVQRYKEIFEQYKVLYAKIYEYTN